MRRLPAEWEPHAAILLTWPHEGTDWAPCLEPAEETYTRICYHIATAGAEKLVILCRTPEHVVHTRHRLRLGGVPEAAAIFA